MKRLYLFILLLIALFVGTSCQKDYRSLFPGCRALASAHRGSRWWRSSSRPWCRSLAEWARRRRPRRSWPRRGRRRPRAGPSLDPPLRPWSSTSQAFSRRRMGQGVDWTVPWRERSEAMRSGDALIRSSWRKEMRQSVPCMPMRWFPRQGGDSRSAGSALGSGCRGRWSIALRRSAWHLGITAPDGERSAASDQLDERASSPRALGARGSFLASITSRDPV